MVTFSEAIIRGGVSIHLHPFVIEALDYFNLVPFQLNPNSIHTMVAFYITFMEADSPLQWRRIYFVILL